LNAINIADLRLAAKRRLPRAVFDYIDGAAETEWTMRENSRVFDDVTLRPRSGVATYQCDLSTTVLGEKIALPLILAPVGSTRMFYPRGEEVAARAAGEAGTIYTLSTLSGCKVEDVKAATVGPVWYQLYLVGGRDVATAAMERAKNAGCSALAVTIDTPSSACASAICATARASSRRAISSRCFRTPFKSFRVRDGSPAFSATAA